MLRTSRHTLSTAPAPDLQRFFDVQPVASAGWLGSDCATSLPGAAPKSETLWVFQDTLVGAFDGAIRDTQCMPHNSLGRMHRRDGPITGLQHLLRGECTGTNASANGFFFPPDPKQFYWVETGARTSAGALHLFAQRMAPPCGIGCTQHGIDLISATEESTWTFSTQEVPGWEPGVSWPTAIGEAGPQLYLLGYLDRAPGRRSAILGRMRRDDLGARWNSLRFWCENATGAGGRGWLPLPAGGMHDLAPRLVALFDDAPPETSLDYSEALRQWFVLSIGFRQPQLVIRLADAPTGPWSAPTVLYTITAPWVSSQSGAFSYSPKHHRELSRADGGANETLIITFMSNGPAAVVARTPQLYVPQVLRTRVLREGGR